ncbi:MAG: hypothetical protein Q9190_007019 [Brigantiaea leucoxantha]
MPGKELSPLGILGLPPKTTHLKAHRVLPKRITFLDDISPSPLLPRSRQIEKIEDVDIQGYTSSERIRSWIPEPSSTQVVPENSPPLTPPLNPAKVGNETRPEHSPLNRSTPRSIQNTSSDLATPTVQRSPPTPETTPPRSYQKRQGLPIPRNLSTTDSFETAREQITSDEEGSRPDSRSLHSSRQIWLRKTEKAGLSNVGLGLGSESEDGEQTPKTSAAHKIPSNLDLDKFDGTWGSGNDNVHLTRQGEYQNGAYGSQAYGAPQGHFHGAESPLGNSPILKGGSRAPTRRSPHSHQNNISGPMQAPLTDSIKQSLDQIKSFTDDDDSELEAKLRKVDNRRLSQISATSTIVSAMVFNTPPRRRQTLRHSSKIANLTSASIQSDRNSSTPHRHERYHTLRHAKALVGKQNQASFSAFTNNTGVEPGNRMVDTASSSRPNTAPEDAVSYFDIPCRDRRTASTHESMFSPKLERRIVQEAPPLDLHEMPLKSQETGSLSRAASSASAGFDSKNKRQITQAQTSSQLNEASKIKQISIDQESVGDWSALRPPSALITPFSIRSARSSTPGTLEVNEATAISIYPHTNKSILVVQHTPRRDSGAPEHSAVIAANAKFALPAGSVQSPVIHQPQRLLDSPLQNPRSPPLPPDFKIIPPTPANATDAGGAEQQAPTIDVSRKRLSAPLSLVKRALSTRRYSESFVAPLARSLSRRRTISSHRRCSTDNDPDGNLHPFWRPRAFWDDVDVEDDEFGNDGVIVGNSLGMPTREIKKHTPPRRHGSLSQRLDSIRIPFRQEVWSRDSKPTSTQTTYCEKRHSGTGAGAMVRNFSLRKKSKFYGKRENHSYEFIQPQANLEGHEKPVVPRLGYQVQFVGFKGLAEKVKERREEARREKVREKLKGSIDVIRSL